MLYVKLALSGSGLTNQIFSLINGIILAIYNGSKIIFIDYFSNDYSKNNYTKIKIV
jgi:Na+-driven multidrug efflux pump